LGDDYNYSYNDAGRDDNSAGNDNNGGGGDGGPVLLPLLLRRDVIGDVIVVVFVHGVRRRVSGGRGAVCRSAAAITDTVQSTDRAQL